MKGIYLLIIQLLFTVCYLNASQDTSINISGNNPASALKNAKTIDEQIEVYRSLANKSRQTPEEAFYLRQMVKLATVNNSEEALFEAWGKLARYYYNTQNDDSLKYWVRCVDSLSNINGKKPDVYFDVYGYVCQSNLWNKNYELAMNEAVHLYNQAQENQNQYGLVCSNENLGLIYQEIHRDSDAIVAYKNGLDILKKIGGHQAYEMQLMGNLAQSYLQTKRFKELDQLLSKYKRMIKDREEENQTQGKSFPVQLSRGMMYTLYANMYTEMRDSQKALEALNKAKPIVEEVNNEYISFRYYYALAKYYALTGLYDNALSTIDKYMDDNYDIIVTNLKADLLETAGRYKEALVYNRQIMAYVHKMNNEAFNRQINQLRTLHDVKNQEVQAYELQLREQQLASQRHQLKVSLFISFILLVLLYIAYRYYRTARRYQKNLMNEKEVLMQSEKQLRQAKEVAEHANQMKSAFIANISHEIRTPLNAIVGFSQLMATESIDKEEKQQFATIITNNSDLLLNLINDVLDLSRIESGSVKLNIENTDLSICCRNALSSIEHRINKGVELVYRPAEEPFFIHTDPLRLQQLLINLLSNASKFTTEGDITLTYEIEEEEQQVRISVTDTGCGIPEEKHEIIFNRFEKIDEYKQGTGLGLSICRSIAEQLGGSIFIDPTYTNGARFVFIQPL